MHQLYELKEMLCEELKEYGSKEKLDVGGLEIVDKLAHAIKNIDKIIEAYEMEEEYSMAGGGSYDGSYRGSYAQGGGGQGGGNQGGQSNRGGGSYARGRGRNARRDSMGRYSREARYSRGGYSRGGSDEMVDELRELMQEAPDQQTRQEFQKLIQKLEQM